MIGRIVRYDIKQTDSFVIVILDRTGACREFGRKHLLISVCGLEWSL